MLKDTPFKLFTNLNWEWCLPRGVPALGDGGGTKPNSTEINT